MKNRLLIILSMAFSLLRGMEDQKVDDKRNVLLHLLVQDVDQRQHATTSDDLLDICSPRGNRDAQDKKRTEVMIKKHNKKAGNDVDLYVPAFILKCDDK